MVRLKHHLRKLLKRLDGLVVVILARDGEKHSAIRKRENRFLKGLKGFSTWRSVSDLDPVDPVLAYNTAPERVVEVKHQDFLHGAFERAGNMRHLVRDIDHEIRRARLLAFKPRPLVAARKETSPGRKKLQVTDMNVWGRAQAQVEIHRSDKRPV